MTYEIKIERDDGKTYTFGGSVCTLLGVDGLDSVDSDEFYNDNAMSDGSHYNGTHINNRVVTVSGKIIRNVSVERQNAVSFFVKSHRYKLYVKYNNRYLYLGGYEDEDCGVLSFYSSPLQNLNATLTIIAELTFNQPYLKSVDEFGKDIAAIQPIFAFPYIDAVMFGGVVADMPLFAAEVQIDNDGDVKTKCRVELTATGTVVNPAIYHGDQYVRLIDTLKLGDKYIIDIINGKIYKNGENNYKAIDRTSSFEGMEFEPGTNAISYDADDGRVNLRVVVYYPKLYSGV